MFNAKLVVANLPERAAVVSPYSYQVFPKSPSGLKGTILGEERAVSLTSGRGKFYLYFRDGKRVEWFALTRAEFDAIAEGKSVNLTKVEEPATADAE
jgi:hypothetical protein